MIIKLNWAFIIFLMLPFTHLIMYGQSKTMEKEQFQPLSYEEALQKAETILKLMTDDEIFSYIGGDRSFFISPIPRLGLKEVYMTDATQGVHIREKFRDTDLSQYKLEKSTAFPCPIALTATWNRELTYQYARAVGEQCRAGGIGILLGPGLNHYRHSQCGRNFEYFGEDPYLRSQLVAEYVKGVQSTGTVATLKHFAANNTDYFRRKSNSIVDERTLNEIYFPGFKAGIDAGAKAVMTAYNLLNSEWCGQSDYVINNFLRNQLGFRWLVMTDWSSVFDGEKVIKSGQDLEMPHALALKDAKKIVEEGRVTMQEVRRMAKSILLTYFAMKLDERKPQPEYYNKFPEHENIALETARESIVLLQNKDNILPLKESVKTILLTGEYVEKLAAGGGSAQVKGYNVRLMIDELKKEFGNRIKYIKNPSAKEIRSADVVLCNVGTFDSEGWDRPFELPKEQEKLAVSCVENNPNTVIIVTSGSGIRMTTWAPKAKAIIYAWYVGQNGNIALAEILSGKTNPSGKLPITIEKEFRDSPGFGYIPEGETLYTGWNDGEEKKRSVYNIDYKEGIFTGYRWYEAKKIEPLFHFGHGLSYTNFEYENLTISKDTFTENDVLIVKFVLKNNGKTKGKEIAQLYIRIIAASVARPVKELKGFAKIELKPDQSATVELKLDRSAFSFWSPQTRQWTVEPGEFEVLIGSSSNDIRLRKNITLVK